MCGCEWYHPMTLTFMPLSSDSCSAEAIAAANCSGLASTRSCTGQRIEIRWVCYHS